MSIFALLCGTSLRPAKVPKNGTPRPGRWMSTTDPWTNSKKLTNNEKANKVTRTFLWNLHKRKVELIMDQMERLRSHVHTILQLLQLYVPFTAYLTQTNEFSDLSGQGLSRATRKQPSKEHRTLRTIPYSFEISCQTSKRIRDITTESQLR